MPISRRVWKAADPGASREASKPRSAAHRRKMARTSSTAQRRWRYQCVGAPLPIIWCTVAGSARLLRSAKQPPGIIQAGVLGAPTRPEISPAPEQHLVSARGTLSAFDEIRLKNRCLHRTAAVSSASTSSSVSRAIQQARRGDLESNRHAVPTPIPAASWRRFTRGLVWFICGRRLGPKLCRVHLDWTRALNQTPAGWSSVLSLLKDPTFARRPAGRSLRAAIKEVRYRALRGAAPS